MKFLTDNDSMVTTNNVFTWLFNRDITDTNLHFWFINVTGRGVWFFYIATTLLIVTGIVMLIVRKKELTDKWVTWACLSLLVGVPLWVGKVPTIFVTALIATVAVWEYTKLVRLPKPETIILHVLAVLYPVAAFFAPSLLQLAPVFALACAIPAVVTGDVKTGWYRATMACFGSLWICFSLSYLVVIWKDAFFVIFAVAAADIGAWCGGKLLKMFAWGSKSLSPLSPNKTYGGLVGGIVISSLMMCLLGSISVGLVLAVGLGAVIGDLLESMVKRQAGVKDAGNWLPGFGGILDRIDSWLLVFPLVATIGAFL